MLKTLISQHIQENGSITLDEYMKVCLQHETFGYYKNNKVLGKTGDFITAPEISQIFGELIGVFISFHLEKIFPNMVYNICEMGAGNAILTVDYLRILKDKKPKNIFFLETNELLKQQQKLNIPESIHINDLSELPSVPTLFIANEFFDALPIKAYKIFGSQMAEIVIIQDENHQLGFSYAELIKNNSGMTRGFYETSPLGLAICADIASHIHHYSGAGLFCDYGYYQTALEKFSFRGFYQHQVTDGLTKLGNSDLTADVNFSELIDVFKKNHLAIYQPLTQSEYLKALHIDTRLHKLLGHTQSTEQKQLLISGVQKLVSPKEMGEKFKFIFVSKKQDEYYPFLNPLTS